MKRTDYDRQAKEFLVKHNFTVKAAFKGDRCPPWDHMRGCIHGDRYRITIKRFGANPFDPGPRSISFDFWNSQADMQANKRPTAYDVLSTIASDANAPTDPDDVAEEYGPMPPSQAIAVAKFARRLQAFFSDEELEDLGEIS